MTVGETLDLRVGSVVTLERLAGETADLLVNGTPIARGEVVVIDEQYGLRVTEILDGRDRDAGSRRARRAADGGAGAAERPAAPRRRGRRARWRRARARQGTRRDERRASAEPARPRPRQAGTPRAPAGRARAACARSTSPSRPSSRPSCAAASRARSTPSATRSAAGSRRAESRGRARRRARSASTPGRPPRRGCRPTRSPSPSRPQAIERHMLLSVELPLVLQALECLLGGEAAQRPTERHLTEIDWVLAAGRARRGRRTSSRWPGTSSAARSSSAASSTSKATPACSRRSASRRCR